MTVVVAWLALVLSAGSLSWQVVSWLRSGARIVIEVMERMDQPDKLVPGALIVVATNVGRLAVTINECTFNVLAPRFVKYGYQYGISVANGENFRLPHRLDPGDELEMSVSTAYLRESIERDRPGATHVRAGVRTGRKWVYAKDTQWIRPSPGPA